MNRSIIRTRRVMTGCRWFLMVGLIFYSLMTTTPFVAEHSAWKWSGPALGLIVDVAFILALSAEGTLARYGVTDLGPWPVAFRWLTGISSVFLNVWVSVAERSPVGVAVHLIAPALVMLLAEVGPIYVAALARAEEAATAVAEAAPEAEAYEPTEPFTESFSEWLDADSEPADEPEPEAAPEPAKLSRTEADGIIEQGWRHRLPVAEVATAAGRHPATVRRKYKALDAQHTA